jgi:3-hydroxypropanoate dehydrogenase
VKAKLASAALNQLFLEARTYNGFSSEPVPEELLHAVYDMAKLGPTSANVSPARFVFVTTKEGKEKLLPHVSKSNRPKTAAAPVTVIVAYALDFAQEMPFLFPHNPDAQYWFLDPVVVQETAMRNGSLQGAYFMLAARALGLDSGPMSGFDKDGVDQAFFMGTSWRSNFLCNLGFGTTENLLPRLPRLSFEFACRSA